MRYRARALIGLLLLGFAAWCALQFRSDFGRAFFAPFRPSWDLVLAAALLSVGNYVLRAIRWRWYLARLGHALPLGFCWLTYSAGFAFTLTPGKLGEVARARYYTAVGMPLRQITAAFCVERLLDLVAILVLALCCVSIFPRYSTVVWVSGSGVAVLLAFGFIMARKLQQGAAAAARRMQTRRSLPYQASYWAGVTRSILQEARPLLTTRALLVGAGLGLCAWSLESLGLYLLGFMFPDSHLTLQAATGIYALAILAGAAVLLPGGLGGTEAAMATLLVSQGVGLSTAVSLTLICRLLTLWLAVAIGLMAILILRLRRPAVGVLLP